jgi:hypothetical protein
MSKKQVEEKQQVENITIKPAKLVVLPLTIEGDSLYVQHKFSEKAKRQIEETQKAGSTANASKGKKRDPKDFEEIWKQAMHIGKDGKHGIPASAFRMAAISACRLIGFKMTLAKLAIFVVADSFDKDEGTPLVHISPKPRPFEDTQLLPVRNDNGSVDLRMRPMWDPGWRATLKIRFDADVFTPTDVANLIGRVGQQVGIGEGRPDSKDSAGVGWGTFQIVTG